MKIRIKNIEFKNPVFTASGTFGYGDELKDILPLEKLGAIVTKGISLKERKGNPPPRLAETPCGLLNSIGLENIGIERFVKEKLPSLKNIGTEIIVNVFGEKIEEYVEISKILEKEGIRCIELNLSCPNVEKGGMEFGRDEKIVRKIVEKVRENFNGVIFVKLSPNFVDILKISKSAEKGGADALTLINTIIGTSIDVENLCFKLKRGFGGLSGPAIRPIALYIVYRVYQEVDIPIAGVGGISDAKSAIEFLLAGATCIQIGTQNFIDPWISFKIIDGIKEFLKRKNMKLEEIIGYLNKK
ncbi:MAG: dihydroorotate dehydrogenase [candidate division WOR-3 bacterium]|uniref:Dihydroorotate dehydrogenase n=1 Tax=candidate division WOR-3 bacterium TaxID=2052148 RepID=A0A7V4E1Y3_UNCW3